MYGWTGKILTVDLTTGKIGRLSSETYVPKYLGGRGVASRIYWEMVKPETPAFAPENALIFMAGPLVASGAQGATRMSIVGKSPATYPEGYCYGNLGGFTPAELKKAGWDGIVVTGQSERPVYLYISDDRAELKDASHLWGQGALRVGELLVQAHGEKVRFLTTGIAGENLVRTAIIFGSHQSTSCGGFGAVLGSKKLKAVAVLGSGAPAVANRAELQELNRYTIRLSKRIRNSIPPIITATNHGHLLEVLGKGACYQCGMECIRGYYRYGKKLEGFRRCQSMEYYLPWKYGLEDEPIDTLFDAPALANDYSISTFELQSIVDWLYSCAKAGVLTDEETGLPMGKIGTREFLEKLLHDIACREGFGELLAEGLVRAGEKVKPEARALFSHAVAPIGQRDLAPPRAIVAHSLIYPMEPRVHQPLIHETAFVNGAWAMNRAIPGSTPVTTKVFHEIARAFWGSEEAGDLSTYCGKALAAKKIQDRTYVKDSLGLCDFGWPITYSFNSETGVGDPDLESRLFTSVTDLPCDILLCGAETVCNQQRAIQLREGRKLPDEDYPPDFNFSEPLRTNARGQPVMVPGPDDSAISASGNVLSKTEFQNILREYYHLRGWDPETGYPRRETLECLGMEDVAEALGIR